MNPYTEHVDFDFLTSMGVTWKFHQPWQLGLFLEEYDGKFVWYPKRGTLMVEPEPHRAKKLGEFVDTEDMYIAIKEYLNEHTI